MQRPPAASDLPTYDGATVWTKPTSITQKTYELRRAEIAVGLRVHLHEPDLCKSVPLLGSYTEIGQAFSHLFARKPGARREEHTRTYCRKERFCIPLACGVAQGELFREGDTLQPKRCPIPQGDSHLRHRIPQGVV